MLFCVVIPILYLLFPSNLLTDMSTKCLADSPPSSDLDVF